MRHAGGRLRLRLGALAGGLLLVLALAQLLLPRLAVSRISSRVGRYGSVHSASVEAWPAIKLLWGSADTVRVAAADLSLSPAQAAALLWEAHGAQTMQVSAAGLQLGPLRLSEASLHKRGNALSGEAFASDADVAAALPPGIGVQLLASEGGRVEVRVSGRLFGVGSAIDAVAEARAGELVVHPLGLLLQGLSLTLFSDPHVYVEGVAASAAAGGRPGYRLRMTASLR